jgi:hypothetical protein
MLTVGCLTFFNTLYLPCLLFSFQVVSSVKWLEDELELNALHNPGSRRGNSNEKAAVGQRTALSAALGSRVEVAAMTTISGQHLFSVESFAAYAFVYFVSHK